jgi:hypothetical protein
LIYENAENILTDVKGNVCKGWDNKGIYTEFSGILTTQQICDVGLAWWECEECGGNDFEIIDNDQKYKCRDCGLVDSVPYVY